MFGGGDIMFSSFVYMFGGGDVMFSTFVFMLGGGDILFSSFDFMLGGSDICSVILSYNMLLYTYAMETIVYSF
jgi:hypothetical protein